MTENQKFDIIETANPVLTVAPIEEETEMLGATDKITALYCRLSVEDMKEGKNGEKADESNSIQTQKMILLCVLKQDHFLRLYRIRLVSLLAVFTFLHILNRQSAIKGGNFVCCS